MANVKRRLFNALTLASFALFILSAGTLLVHACWGNQYRYVGHRPQYVVAVDDLKLIVQRQDGTFTVQVPLPVCTVLFALLPAAWLDERYRRRDRQLAELLTRVPTDNGGEKER